MTGPNDWTIATAFEQLEHCGFRCQGGPLENNVAYQWLKAECERLFVEDRQRDAIMKEWCEAFKIANP